MNSLWPSPFLWSTVFIFCVPYLHIYWSTSHTTVGRATVVCASDLFLFCELFINRIWLIDNLPDICHNSRFRRHNTWKSSISPNHADVHILRSGADNVGDWSFGGGVAEISLFGKTNTKCKTSNCLDWRQSYERWLTAVLRSMAREFGATEEQVGLIEQIW